MNQPQIIGRQQAVLFATIGLIMALLLVFVMAGTIPRFMLDIWHSVAIAVGALYFAAGMLGMAAGSLIDRFRQPAVISGIVGIGLAESTLLIAAVAGAGVGFIAHSREGGAFADYIGKPVFWVMLVGSLPALVLGIIYAYRVRKILEKKTEITAE